MATKTVVADRVTLCVAGPKNVPFEFDIAGNRIAGYLDLTDVPPGTPVELDADEADALIARGVVTEYAAPAAVEAPAPKAKRAAQ